MLNSFCFGYACGVLVADDVGLANPAIAVDELVAIAPTVAKEVSIDFSVVSSHDLAQHTVPFSRGCVAAQATVNADRRRHLHIPLSRVMSLQGFVGENSRRADLHQIAAELVLQYAVGLATEINLVPQAENIKVPASRIFAIKTHATVTLDAAVHFVIDQRTQILIAESAFVEGVPAIVMTGHHRHVLKV